MDRSLLLFAALPLWACGNFTPDVDGGAHDAMVSDGETTSSGVLAKTLASPVDLVVGGGFVYWVDEGTAGGDGHDGNVMRVPTAGCAPMATSCPTVIAPKRNSPGAIALSEDGTLLFWSELTDDTGDPTNGKIFSFALGTMAAPTTIASGQDGPYKIAVDDQSVYWINNGANELRREFIDEGTPNGLVIAHVLAPRGLTVTTTTASVFVSSWGTDGSDGTVMSFDSEGQEAITIAKNLQTPQGMALGPTFVYWVNSGTGTLFEAMRDGTSAMPVDSSLATPSACAIDGERVYWVEAGSAPYYTDGRVATSKLDGSDLRVLATNRIYPRSIALDNDSVYWVDRGTEGGDMYDGAVEKAPKPISP